jgi:hypothetical protein
MSVPEQMWTLGASTICRRRQNVRPLHGESRPQPFPVESTNSCRREASGLRQMPDRAPTVVGRISDLSRSSLAPMSALTRTSVGPIADSSRSAVRVPWISCARKTSGGLFRPVASLPSRNALLSRRPPATLGNNIASSPSCRGEVDTSVTDEPIRLIVDQVQHRCYPDPAITAGAPSPPACRSPQPPHPLGGGVLRRSGRCPSIAERPEW